jgi:NAD dependent epimerase/dehydratase family enzyme
MSERVARGRVVIAGGSGFLGLSLATHLTSRGWSVVVLSRNPPRREFPWSHVSWDARNLGEWSRSLHGASGLVNLGGRSGDCVKTPDHRDEILRSRTEATRVLGLAVRSVDTPPPVWVQMSTAHIYGDPPDRGQLRSMPSTSEQKFLKNGYQIRNAESGSRSKTRHRLLTHLISLPI